jgi:hypothetical protein
VLRPASQGADLYVHVKRFLEGKEETSKAFDHRGARVGFQESSPQNNFRRIIASYIPAGEYCNHKVNYIPEAKSKVPLEFILGLLNSKMSDWYFRLGSTNAAVSHYQILNLPCPEFAGKETPQDVELLAKAMIALNSKRLDGIPLLLVPAMTSLPFGTVVRDVIVAAVKKIIAVEGARAGMKRKDRSALDPAAQPYQDLIDRLFFKMAGFNDAEGLGLEARLAKML